MSFFNYKNPLSSEIAVGSLTVDRDDTKGTTFSVGLIGGYMEVWSLDDLKYTIYGTGNIEDERNRIPIQYYERLFGGQSNTLTINNDLISSGRRRLGMLVYVHETDTTYQYVIPNYENLFDPLSAYTGGLVITGDTTWTISTGSQFAPNADTTAFVDAWLDSSIEGVSGVTRENARWRIFWGTDWQVTGGTVDYNSTGDLNLNSNSGNTVTISGLKTITGGTYFSGTSTLTLYNNLGETIDINGFTGGQSGTSGSSGSSGTSGSSGESGTSGSSGSSGTSGSSGESGTSGSSGSSGTSGSSGESGTSGSSGSSGTSGSSGESGTSGSSGSSGTSGSSGSSGTSGNSFTGGTITYDANGRLTFESEDPADNINVDGFKTITGGTYLSASTTLELYNNLAETIQITGFTTGGGDISVSANTGLGIIDPNILYTIYNTTLSPSLEMDTTVGGIEAGTTVSDLTGKTFVDMFNDLLFPTVLPTYTQPSIILSGLTSKIKEVGSTEDIDVVAYGVKNDAGDYQNLIIRTGTTSASFEVVTDNNPSETSVTNLPNQFGFPNPNNPNSGFTSIALNYTLTVPTPASTTSTVKYDAIGDYGGGLAIKDNKGDNTTTSPISSGTADSTDITITGIYPYFWGVSSTEPTTTTIAAAISGGTANKVLSQANNTITITFNATEEYLWFAHLSNYTTKSSWYVAEGNEGNIGTGDDLFGAVSTTSVDSPETYWTGINYKIYISNYPTTTAGGMQLRN